ncbi:MAG: hypothetical protein HYU81_03230 [Candidatus Brennerbacteria bacterium]|nr:hypothetical protein [Candidatus Brennerbacteria bacterium]
MRGIKIAFWILIAIVLSLTAFAALRAGAATNVSSASNERLAWDDENGWWDFYSTNTVTIYGTRLEGYASSTVGDLSLDCATTASGNVCASSNYGVCNGPGPHATDGACASGDASGDLTGYAWNDAMGWVSFNCNQSSHGGANNCVSSNYKVSIDANGNFSGYAWNDVAGWLSFNCADAGGSSCGDSNYKVITSWRATSTFAYLESSVFDTERSEGGALQSIVWQGSQPSGASVDFQIATSSSSSGPWTFYGPGGSSVAYYGAECPLSGIASPGAGPDKAICVDKNAGAARYLRYKIRLRSNLLQTQTPSVDDVILIWTR